VLLVYCPYPGTPTCPRDYRSPAVSRDTGRYIRLGGQGQGLSLHTTEWIDLQTALRIRSSLHVVLGVVFALPTAFACTLALPILLS
jgi:hypothetical protein